MGDQLTGGAVLMCRHRMPELLAALVAEAAATTRQPDVPDVPERQEPDVPVPAPVP